MAVPENRPHPQHRRRTSRHERTPPRTLIIKQAALILALWLIWFVLRFPGNTDPDTEIELLEYYGLMQANNHHPWFDTMLFGVFWSIGNCLGSNWWSVGLWAAFQSIATALALSTSIWYARYVGVKSHYAWIASVFVGVMPIYPTLAQTMAKDMIFGWLWVLYALLYIETLRTRGALLNRRWAIAAWIGLGICLALTKKNRYLPDNRHKYLVDMRQSIRAATATFGACCHSAFLLCYLVGDYPSLLEHRAWKRRTGDAEHPFSANRTYPTQQSRKPDRSRLGIAQ